MDAQKQLQLGQNSDFALAQNKITDFNQDNDQPQSTALSGGSHQQMSVQFYQNHKRCSTYKFYMLTFSGSIVPIGYFAIQVCCLSVLMKGAIDQGIIGVNGITFALLLSTLLTFAFYCLSAFKNPGFVQGNQFYDAAVSVKIVSVLQNNGAYNPNLDVMRKDGPYGQDMRNNPFQVGFRKGFHQRKTSVLTKGLQISRHERNKPKNTFPSAMTSEATATIEQLETQPNQMIVQTNQFNYNSNFEIMVNSQSSTPNSQTSQISTTFTSPLNQLDPLKPQGGTHHRRIPSYLKSIPLTKINKPVNEEEQNRKKAYETIAQKITNSNQTTNTLNDDDYESQNYYPDSQNPNNQYSLSPLNANHSNLNLKDGQKYELDTQSKFTVTTQDRTNLEDDTQQFQTQTSPKQLKIQANPVEVQKRLLISRNQMRSDQACLQIIDSVIEEQESQDNIDSDRIEQASKGPSHSKSQSEVQMLGQHPHKKLNEDLNVFTESLDEESKQGKISTKQELNDSEEDVILFVEYKYCTVCHIEQVTTSINNFLQPLRCKHCKYCDHCVATYDHHCPWIGNCVGERNRFSFFWFLLFQTSQLIIAMIYAFLIFQGNDGFGETTKVFSALLICVVLTVIGFFFMVSSLLVFHSYLSSKNLTTWESLSWMKISYMKVWPKRHGSPFSKGSLKQNLKLFCCYKFTKSKCIYQWEMPNKLPKLK